MSTSATVAASLWGRQYVPQCFFDACGDNIEELTETLILHHFLCWLCKTQHKQVTIFPNNKPCITKDLKFAINRKKTLFFTGDAQEKNTVYKEVKAEIAKAKDKYKEKI